MKQAVADTRALVWMGAGGTRLGRHATRRLQDAMAGRATVSVPAMALVEIGEGL